MLPIGGVLGMNLLLSSEQGSLSYNLNLDAIALTGVVCRVFP